MPNLSTLEIRLISIINEALFKTIGLAILLRHARRMKTDVTQVCEIVSEFIL